LTEKKPRFNLKYPSLTARRYGAVINRENNHTLLDPVSSFLALAYVLKPNELKTIFRIFKENYEPSDKHIFDSKEYKLQIGFVEDKGTITGAYKRRCIQDFTDDNFVFGLEQAIKNKSKIMWGSVKRALKQADDNHLSPQNIGGLVASKTRGWNNANITGPYENSKLPFNAINCDCKDEIKGKSKQGFRNLSHLCFHSALLLQLASTNPELFKDTKYDGQTISTPFQTPEGLLTEVLIAKYIANFSNPKIAQRLLKDDSILSEKIKQLNPTYEVIENRNYTRLFHGEQRNFLNKIINTLKSIGYRQLGCVYESRGTEHEAVCLDFEKQKNGKLFSARIYIKDGPPLLITRNVKHTNPKKQRTSEHLNDNPWENLYYIGSFPDDKYRRSTAYQAKIPIFPGFSMSRKIIDDYKEKFRTTNFGRDSLMKRINNARYGKRIQYNQAEHLKRMLL